MSPEEDALVRVVRALERSSPSWSGRGRPGDPRSRAYIERWARELGIMDLWQEITAHLSPEK